MQKKLRIIASTISVVIVDEEGDNFLFSCHPLEDGRAFSGSFKGLYFVLGNQWQSSQEGFRTLKLSAKNISSLLDTEVERKDLSSNSTEDKKTIQVFSELKNVVQKKLKKILSILEYRENLRKQLQKDSNFVIVNCYSYDSNEHGIFASREFKALCRITPKGITDIISVIQSGCKGSYDHQCSFINEDILKSLTIEQLLDGYSLSREFLQDAFHTLSVEIEIFDPANFDSEWSKNKTRKIRRAYHDFLNKKS